jgi:hypothetical protein
MSRVSMNLEAAGKLADALSDIAVDLEQRANEIDGILDDAGKNADAPGAARNSAQDCTGRSVVTSAPASRCCKKPTACTGPAQTNITSSTAPLYG